MSRAKGLGVLEKTSRDLRFLGSVLLKRPFHVQIQVTNRCNLRCSFCDFWPNGVAPKYELSCADYRRVADQLAEMGCFVVSVEGGEPMMRPDIIEIVQAFARRHVPVVYTSGWFIDADKAKALFDAGAAQVGVSIDFPDAGRHDRKRGREGTFERAWRAIDLLRDHAPHAGAQVHVISVLMRENQADIEDLLRMSAAHGVGHCLTLLSISGFRRGKAADNQMPDADLAAQLQQLWPRYPHLRAFRDYFAHMDAFLEKAEMPRCHAGQQSFNIDHIGNVSPCIERIDAMVGNVRLSPMSELVARMQDLEAVRQCQDCWTLCRGFTQSLGQGASWRSLQDLATRMRSQ